MISLGTELYFTIQRAYRELIPYPQDREPLTWETAPYAFGYVIPFLFMAYLVRRRDTYNIRLLLLPTVLVMIIRGTFGYGGFDPDYYFYNWLRGLGGMATIAASLDYAFTQKGKFKVGETALPAVGELEPLPGDENEKKGHPLRRSAGDYLPLWLSDAQETMSAMRGIGWDFGKGVYIPHEWRPLQKGPFLRATTLSFIKNYLIIDFCIAAFKLVPAGQPDGGSMFDPNLPPIQRYVVSTAIQILAGLTLIPGFEVLYSLATLIGVGVLNQSPAQWPPLMGNPWGADSLHDFWAKRWHQLLRRPFLVLGGIPGGWLAPKYGYVLGTFVASGLFHEFGTYTMGRGIDHRVTWFFTLQGVGVLLEKLFAKATGRKVSGWSGRIWTYLIILGLGQMCMDAWFSRGVVGGIIIPKTISPARRFFLPTIRSIIHTMLYRS